MSPAPPLAARPPLGVPIDGTSPLAAGLLSFWTFAEGSGLLLDDASEQSSPLLIAGTPAWTYTPGGVALRFMAVGQYASTTIPVGSGLYGRAWPMTLAVAFRQLGTGMPTSLYVGITGVFNINYSSTQGFSVTSFNGAANVATTVGGVPANNTDYVLAATVTPTAISFYQNGVLRLSNPQASAAPTWGTPPNYLFIGGAPSFLTGNAMAAISWAGWWNADLGAGGHAMLASNPWRLFAANPLMWMPLPAAPVGGGMGPYPLLYAGMNQSTMDTP